MMIFKRASGVSHLVKPLGGTVRLSDEFHVRTEAAIRIEELQHRWVDRDRLIELRSCLVAENQERNCNADQDEGPCAHRAPDGPVIAMREWDRIVRLFCEESGPGSKRLSTGNRDLRQN